MTAKKRMSEILFERYEYLAKIYASKIFAFEELSFEYDDLLQEFKLKIYTSIKAYGRAWKAWREGRGYKPIPLEFYLKNACGNKMRDFMKYISRENYKVRIDEIDYDFGVESETKIVPEDNEFVVNGIDLLENLEGKERLIFSLYLRGYNKGLLTKVYVNTNQEKNLQKEILKNDDIPLSVSDIIEFQKDYLIKKYGNELRQAVKVFCSFSVNDD